ncbi:DUF3048 domain-containing protein [Caminicella sporogenes]|uniref:DUF3048 domain-containing protein n=1 Tax=Caminicella sporogenes TaxID=166485 RepID=UPI00253FDAFD|nr:DUF3048 domain-containing protein [Caminicella sporogenes]WIF94793.1 DUF3048 domain-containing protein [Caminicella sporogenes]
MKKYIFLIMILLLFTGCSKSEPALKDDNSVEQSIIEEDNNKVVSENNIKDSIDNLDKKVNDREGKIKSPLTGLYIEKEQLNPRPIAVMIDNYYKARPQAGLSEADIIYEILAEGNITRYMAIIYSSKPSTIGPVRSARPYFISKALEYDPLYVHVGGSPQALKDVKALKMADIDALSCGKNTFWRKRHKPIPNNMYTSYEALIKEAHRRKYKANGNFKTLSFNEEDTDIEGQILKDIKFPYRKNYVSEFRYNDEEKLYYRYINNKPHRDEVTKIHLSAKNIIVQYTNTKVIDSKGRLDVNLIGKGKGFYITNGKIMKIIWKKGSRRDITRFYDLNENEIKLNPGITWYQIVPSNLKIIMN